MPLAGFFLSCGPAYAVSSVSGPICAVDKPSAESEGVLSAKNWAALAPELLWPVWGAALGAATLAYYCRRRGKCRHCG